MKPFLGCAAALVISLCLAGTAPVQEPGADEKFPVSGKAAEGLEVFDRLMIAMVKRHNIPGAALAIAKDGKLILAKGYGWSDLEGDLAMPTTRFLLASLSKPITAAAILRLIEEGKLSLDDLVLELLRHLIPPGGVRDQRMRKITVRQLLNHSGGWNRNVSGDPSTWTAQTARRFGLPVPPQANDLITFMMTNMLDFDPGTDTQYSNIGYMFLGAVIEKVTGQSYEAYVKKNVLEPMGITKARIQSGPKYLAGEARRYLSGLDGELPPLQAPMVAACAGWCASPVDLVRFLTAMDGSRGKKFLKEDLFALTLQPPKAPLKARADGTFSGLCWATTFHKKDKFGYFQDGHWHGARAFMKRTPDGINWALAFNTSMQPDNLDTMAIRETAREVHERLETLDHRSDTDLFSEY